MKRGPSIDTTNENERLARIDIPITGMSCASCVRRVERALSRKDGVAGVSVNLASERASVAYEPTTTSPKTLTPRQGAASGRASPGGRGHCKATVESEMSKISGIESSNADVEKGTVEVSYDERIVTTEDLKVAIVEAGYTVAA